MKNVIILGADGLLASDIIEMIQYDGGASIRSYSKQLCDITTHKNVYFNLIGETTHVINCAAITDINYCEQNAEKAYEVNETAVKNLVEICLENHIHLTHFSTAEVFDGTKPEPYLENDQVSPLSIYAKSKAAGEGHVLAMGDKGLVIRTNCLFGKYRDNFVQSTIKKLMNKEIVETTDEISNATYTLDLANVALTLALSNKSGLYHVTNSDICTKTSIALKLAELMNLDKTLIKEKHIGFRNIALSPFRINQTIPEKLRSWEDALYQYLLEIGKVT